MVNSCGGVPDSGGVRPHAPELVGLGVDLHPPSMARAGCPRQGTDVAGGRVGDDRSGRDQDVVADLQRVIDASRATRL